MELNGNHDSEVVEPSFGASAQAVGSPITLAVVEDDEEYRETLLLPMLSSAGFSAEGMASALDLYRAMTSRRYELVLLDAGLPDEDGFSIAAHLRSLSATVGIVMLTGCVSAEDRMRGLNSGVDAYLTKPVDMGVLRVTLRNLARRVLPESNPAGGVTGWRLDDSGWCILSPGGAKLSMSLPEKQVMSMLAVAPGVAVRRERLIAHLVENVHDFDPHRLEMLVYRLRKRCLKLTQKELPLRSVRGVGYVLTW